MEFLKVAMCDTNYYIVVDKMPVLKYERVGNDYVGKAFDANDDLICTHKLSYSKALAGMKAFGGSRITIPLADGSSATLQNDYWDNGADSSVGESVYVMTMTGDDYKKYHHFRNIKGFYFAKEKFDALLARYALKDRIYSLWEAENPVLTANATSTFV